MDWSEIIGYAIRIFSMIFKIEVGVFLYKLNGVGFWNTFIVGCFFTTVHLSLIFGLFDLIVRIFRKPYKLIEGHWRALQKAVNIFALTNNHFGNNKHKIKRWLIKKQYLWFFTFYAIPFVPFLSGGVIATVKVTRANSKKGFIAMLCAVPFKVLITAIIIFHFPKLAENILHFFHII